MLPQILLDYPDILNIIRREKIKTYLVGGAVRDLLREKNTHDLDFVVLGDARRLAKMIANQSNGAFFMLDDQRNTARVLMDSVQGSPTSIDFASARGGTLEDDLLDRDFTINALAIDLETGTLVDPLKGASDLKNGALRSCTSQSFLSDPLRILRGIRFSLAFNLQIEKETRDQMQSAVHLMRNVSGERIRDELFRILGTGQSAPAIRLMQHFRVIPVVLPELDFLFTNTSAQYLPQSHSEFVLSAIEKTDILLDLLVEKPQEKHENLMTGLVVLTLGEYREHTKIHYTQSLNPNRQLRSLILFTALFCFSKQFTVQVYEKANDEHFPRCFLDRCKNLALSNQEILRAQKILSNFSLCEQIADADSLPDRTTIFHHFNKISDAGIDICVLKLAKYWAEQGFDLEQEAWLQRLKISKSFFNAWWNQYHEVISPPPLVNGNELCAEFSITPSPIIGELLDKIKEAQAAGLVKHKDEALALARKILKG